MISSKSPIKIDMPENVPFCINLPVVFSSNIAAYPSSRIVALQWKHLLPQDLFFGVQRENEFLTVAI